MLKVDEAEIVNNVTFFIDDLIRVQLKCPQLFRPAYIIPIRTPEFIFGVSREADEPDHQARRIGLVKFPAQKRKEPRIAHADVGRGREYGTTADIRIAEIANADWCHRLYPIVIRISWQSRHVEIIGRRNRSDVRCRSLIRPIPPPHLVRRRPLR